MRQTVLLSTLALIVLAPAIATAEDAGNLARDLARLRSDVENLSQELNLAREDARAGTRSLALQKQELEAEIRREELRLKQLEAARAKQIEAADAHKERVKALEPVARRELVRVRRALETTLPFRLDERLAEIDKLEEQLNDGLLTPEKVLARLWERVEDELRLGHESGLYKQVVELEGQEFLADVIRVGTVWLYLRTPDGRYGQIVRGPEGWRAQAFTDPKEAAGVALLFESFEKQIRVGHFELPVRWGTDG